MIPELTEPQRVAASARGVASTQHFEATNAAAELLAAGGNAVDAAVAAAFALGVVEPAGSGLGGQTMAMVHLAEERRTVALDGSSRAPSRVTPEVLTKLKTRLRGHLATTVPSTPAVLGYMNEVWGKLPLSRCLEPAIRLAEEGYRITSLQHRLQVREDKHWQDGNARDFFLKDGRPYEVGEIFRQPVLAKTLRRIAEHGITDFYQGEIASEIHEDMANNGGALQKDDLANLPWPIERKPLSCRYEGLRVLTFPPPAAGRTVVEMLQVLAHFPDKTALPFDPEGALLLAEVIRRAQLDRRDRPYDPNFYPQVQDRRMTSLEYAELVAKQIKKRLGAVKKKPAEPLGLVSQNREAEAEGRGETTHLSVVDGLGNAVALTQSIERVYGSFAVTPSLGFLYNNYLSAFDYDDYTNPYYMRPNGVPWASVAPTLVFKGRRFSMALGSPGSERIASAVLQVILRSQKQSPFDAVIGPRLHASARGTVSFEAPWLRDDIPDLLTRAGFKLDPREALAFYLGCVQLVARDGGRYIGVADPRRDGAAKGPA